MTLTRAIIIHGYGADPASHWFPWLAGELEAAGIATTVPELPDPLDPDDATWRERATAAIGVPDEHTAVIGHSLGCLTALRAFAAAGPAARLGALVLVSGFLDRLPGFAALDAFIGDGADVTGMSERIGRVTLIRSDDDAIVPAALTDALARRLGVEPVVVAGAGHFLGPDGHLTLPAARDALLGAPARPDGAASPRPQGAAGR